MSDQVAVIPRDDRTMPAVIYGLYLIGLSNGLTILIGLVLAYATRATASPKIASHLTFLIRTFWLSIVWWGIGGAIALVGGVFSIILIGLPFLWLGLTIMGAIWFWFAARAIVGAVHLARDEAYPRPDAWLI